MNLGSANRSHSVKRHFGDLEQLPSQKSFKRHKSFDISQPTYGLHDDTVYDGYIDEKRRLPSTLPVVQGKHRDLNAISADTVNIIFAFIPNHSDSFS